MAYQHLLTQTGRHEEALAEGARAVALEPLSLIINANHGWAMFFAGQIEEAISQTEKTLDLHPDFWVAHLNRGKMCVVKGEYRQAVQCFEKAYEFSGGGNTEALSMMGYASALGGDRSTAQQILTKLQARASTQYTPPFNIAVVYAGLDATDHALEWLERALAERDVHAVFLKCDPKWRDYRKHPRFKAVLQRLGLGDSD
jgi:tetratricopeptide (TPR) repeat protein